MKPATSVLLAMLSFGCAAGPPAQMSDHDPGNPQASEAPAVLPAKVLPEDPPPPAALQDAADAGVPQSLHHHPAMDGGAP